ncbi:MAG: hypothetical protein Q8K45_12545 [Rubrivivax sp.]|nr:hypothetical protein [Rubrivivax sp.]
MTVISVYTPAPVAMPRAAPLAAAAFLRVLGWFERLGQARSLAREHATRAAEARAVRSYAQRYASHDPRFAADLLAAADRHERAA